MLIVEENKRLKGLPLVTQLGMVKAAFEPFSFGCESVGHNCLAD